MYTCIHAWLDQKQLHNKCPITYDDDTAGKSGFCVSALWLHQKPETALVNHLHANCQLYIVQVNPGIKEMW